MAEDDVKTPVTEPPLPPPDVDGGQGEADRVDDAVPHLWPAELDANYTLFSWTLGDAAAGNMTVSAPASATTGATGTIGLSFSDLAPATKYLGSVVYGGSDGLPAPTIVRVDTP